MRNTPVPAGFGPAPAGPGRDLRARLSPQRAAVLDRLVERVDPTSIVALAGELGLHPSTVRQHLGALVRDGSATRALLPARGRGRPAWGYAAVVGRAGTREGAGADSAGLAAALAAHLSRTSPDPVRDGRAAGEEWGRQLFATAPPQSASARHAVVRLLGDLGFDPAADDGATTVALRRCPLLDTARRYPDVVCSVHLGLVRGALVGLGADPAGTEMLPFAEPGACRLHLRTVGRSEGARDVEDAGGAGA